MYPCPCCGFIVFIDAPGSYEICPVCEWEDDEVQLRFPGYPGGANHHSLCECQSRARSRIPDDAEVFKGYRRHSRWRPLRPDECIRDPDEREPFVYYWDRVSART